jgi:hypothetical protein
MWDKDRLEDRGGWNGETCPEKLRLDGMVEDDVRRSGIV